MVEVSEKGVAISEGGELKAAVRKVAERIKDARPRFDSTKTVDILSRLPEVEMLPINEAALESMERSGKLTAAVEGVWAATDQSGSRLGIVASPQTRDFSGVVLESPRSYVWQPGMVRARLIPAADGRTFVAKWRTGDRTEVNGLALLDEGVLTLSFTRNGREQTIRLLKMRPSGAGPTTSPIASSSGTGFMCGANLVATNAHVVEGARRIQMYLPVQRQTVNLELLTSDASNDLAILRIVGESTSGLSPLPLLDSREVKLGTDAIVVGFPLGDTLGAGHKVTAGLVSALEGLGGDPRKIQLTASIQAGSSGSPVLDRSGRVLGIVTSTLNTATTLRSSGQVPQNVNFAVKSDYLSLLLRRVPTTGRLESRTAVAPADPSVIVERVRRSVGRILVQR